ncbi:MAG: alpha-amylase/4-alpha-glucanotransferase domain-containing protein [Nitrospirota bacterium]
MNKLRLILAFHNHQPVGNFDDVFEEAYQKSYLPFLKVLERHPDLKIVLHYSGSLLSWIKANHREFLDSLKALAREGRAEFLTGGFYEPLLSSIPGDDRTGQIKKLTEFISDEFGYQAKGMWLAERVWEPDMPEYLARAGISYLPVDDYHFKLTGLTEKELRGYFITESGGYTVNIFPGSEELRYRIPFHEVKDVISYLKEVYEESGPVMLSMADDGEKFGIWPGTYKLVYTNGWLEQFFEALAENSSWIETTTYEEYISKNAPLGRIYLPTASYREMGEWAMMSGGSREYESDLEEMKKIFGSKKAQALIRGGIWKNFFTKYPESNHIHKRMFFVSRKVHQAVRRVKAGDRASKKAGMMLDELWQGQCNDAYWHGIFGGLYLPHLRSSLYRHMLKAEKLAEDIISPAPVALKKGDIDKDGYNDLFVSTKSLSLFFSEIGGNLCELSYKDKAVNILDTLSRRSEPYHKKIISAVDSKDAGTIHDSIKLKDKSITADLVFDPYRKTSLIDHFLTENTTFAQFKDGLHKELWDQMGKPYSVKTAKSKKMLSAEFKSEGKVLGEPASVKKKISISDSRPLIKAEYDVDAPEGVFFCTEFNISLLGSPYPTITIDPDGRKKPAPYAINTSRECKGVQSFSIKDEYLGVSISFDFDAGVDLWHFPVETVSLSEGGIEKIYQGTTFIIIPGDKKGRFGFEVRLRDI